MIHCQILFPDNEIKANKLAECHMNTCHICVGIALSLYEKKLNCNEIVPQNIKYQRGSSRGCYTPLCYIATGTNKI
jgi:hypothetical protein